MKRLGQLFFTSPEEKKFAEQLKHADSQRMQIGWGNASMRLPTVRSFFEKGAQEFTSDAADRKVVNISHLVVLLLSTALYLWTKNSVSFALFGAYYLYFIIFSKPVTATKMAFLVKDKLVKDATAKWIEEKERIATLIGGFEMAKKNAEAAQLDDIKKVLSVNGVLPSPYNLLDDEKLMQYWNETGKPERIRAFQKEIDSYQKQVDAVVFELGAISVM